MAFSKEAKTMANLPKNIKQLISSYCKRLGLNPNLKGYVDTHSENLIDNFPNWEEIMVELGNGQGSELKPDKSGIIKFNALHSSSALCINSFAPIKAIKNIFEFYGQSNFTYAHFEKKLPTGISIPNLDFYLENNHVCIGFESKFIEHLTYKLPNRNNNLEKYRNRKELQYLDNTLSEVLDYYINCKEKLYLDVAQLIKHSIGLIRNSQSKSIHPVLVYIYWLPQNWRSYNLFVKHQKEVHDFSRIMKNTIDLLPMSYLDFWNQYQDQPELKHHIKKLKERYYFRI